MAQQGPGQPLDLHDCEGSGSRFMLEEERDGEGERDGGDAGGGDAAERFREMAAVVASWQQWRKEEAMVQCVAAKALAAGDAWRAAEENYIVAEAAAERAGGLTREAFALLERARLGGHSRQAIAARRMEAAKEEEWRAIEAAGAAEDEFFEAGDVLDRLEAAMEAAEDTADAARERLRGAEKRAAWLRAVMVVGRQRAAWRRRLRGATGEAEDGATRVVGGGAESGAEGTVGGGAVDGAEGEVDGAEGEESGTRSAVMLLVAEEAAAEGAARQELGRFAAVLGTWLAALARERSRRRAAGEMRPLRAEGAGEGAVGDIRLPALVPTGGIPSRWVPHVALEKWMPSATSLLARPSVPLVRRRRCGSNLFSGGDDGGSWRQFDPGG
jgi:hypothetical protein